MEFSRQPRLMPDYSAGELDIENPVSIGEKPEIFWFQTFVVPLVMVCVTVFMFLAGKSVGGFINNPLFLASSLAMTGISIIGSIIALNHQISKHNSMKTRRDLVYKGYIKEKDAELLMAAEQQARALRQLNPSPGACVSRMNADPVDPRIWERTPGYDDFLSFRLGIGAAKAALTVRNKRAAGHMETDPLADEPRKLALKYEMVHDVPVCVDLRNVQICGIVGLRDKAAVMINNIIIQIAAHHGYDNVRIFIIAEEDELKNWAWARFLPHLWNDSFTARRIVCGRDMAKLMLDEVYADLKERERKGDDVVFSLYYVFIVLSADIIADAPIRRYIYEPNGNIGVTAVFAVEHAALLPANCGSIVTLKRKTAEIYNRNSNEKNNFTPDSGMPNELETAARKISPLRIKSMSSLFSLPKSITLSRMLGENDFSRLDVSANWRKRRCYNGMDVAIGVKPGGGLLYLDLHEMGHGPHGLVAGTTGSGKSELLQSVIISLAINFHPHDLVFVLIDYKGGGMADVFRGMPHLAGVVTNLGGGQTTRALLSIKSEIRRRQALFAEFGVNSIDRYQRQYYGQNRPVGMKPIPRLVMIADEFAELRQDQPDFMKQLVSAARVGRSLGIHLILATQKPDGVVDDQIWSNSRFKICLKVQTESDSNGVLRKPDAAYIREPGRAYMQVGGDEIYELFQSAYAGADYITDAAGTANAAVAAAVEITDAADAAEPVEIIGAANVVDTVNAVEIADAANVANVVNTANAAEITRTVFTAEKAGRDMKIYRISIDGGATRIYPPAGAERSDGDGENQSQLETMVRHIIRTSESEGITPLDGPWTEPLAEFLYFNEMSEQGLTRPSDSPLSAAAGLVDDPGAQRKYVLEFDFAAEGGLLVYGASGSGKTSLLKTLCLSLAVRYSPDEVNIYLMDMGRSALKAFGGLPHCGGVLTIDRERDIRQFVFFLFRTAENRKRIFEMAFVESFVDYRKKGHEMPAIIVMIDAYAPFAEIYEDLDERITTFARDAFRYGIYLVVTATTARDIRYRLSTSFKMAVTFELIDRSYSEIVGRTEGLEPESYRGRGLVKLEKPLEFQAALPEYLENGVIRQTREIVECLAVVETRRAVPIPVMPERVTFRELNRGKKDVWIGLNDSDLTPVQLNFTEFVSFMITGEPDCGKSTVASLWLTALNDAEIYAMDSLDGGFALIIENENVKDLATVNIDDFVAEFEEELNSRRSALSEARKSGKDVSEAAALMKQMIFAFDRFSEAAEDEEYYNLMKLIVRIVKKEHGLKVAVLALDTLDGFADNYSDAGRAVKAEQTGLLLGSLKEQSLFNAALPYRTPEKEISFGDGYLVRKNRFIGLRAAF